MSNRNNQADDPAPEEPAFLDDDGPSAEVPPFITTTNARELYDLRLVIPCPRPSSGTGTRPKRADQIQSTTTARYDAPPFSSVKR